MEIGNIIPHIEALIFASDKPLTSMEITELINNAFGFMEEKLTLEQIQTSIDGIREKYASEFYPFEVRESGGGWQFLTKKDFHKTIAQLNGEKFLKRLSSAALETLAIIAYKQPITKGEIEAIRGVSSDYSIQKLLEKELIVIAGRSEDMVGKPLIYTTSKTFMDYFGINSAADLPKLKEVFAETLAEPTLINHTPAEADEEGAPQPEQEATTAEDEAATAEDEAILIVSEEGELKIGSDTQGEATADQQDEESDEQADEGDAASLDEPIPPYADDDLDAEGPEEEAPEGEEEEEKQLGEGDEEADDDANLHDPASDESDENDPQKDDDAGHAHP